MRTVIWLGFMMLILDSVKARGELPMGENVIMAAGVGVFCLIWDIYELHQKE